MYCPVTWVKFGSTAAYSTLWQPSFAVFKNNHFHGHTEIFPKNVLSSSNDFKWLVSLSNPGLTAFIVILESVNMCAKCFVNSTIANLVWPNKNLELCQFIKSFVFNVAVEWADAVRLIIRPLSDFFNNGNNRCVKKNGPIKTSHLTRLRFNLITYQYSLLIALDLYFLHLLDVAD